MDGIDIVMLFAIILTARLGVRLVRYFIGMEDDEIPEDLNGFSEDETQEIS